MNNDIPNDNKMTLKKLIIILPFKDDVRNKLLEILDKLTPDQKYRLTDLCWEVYEMIHTAEYRNKVDNAILEMAKSGKEYSPHDFEKMGQELLLTYEQKLDSLEEDQRLKEIRMKLKTEISPSPPPTKSG